MDGHALINHGEESLTIALSIIDYQLFVSISKNPKPLVLKKYELNNQIIFITVGNSLPGH